MIRTNIFDKLQVLINIVTNEPFMLIMLILYLFLAVVLLYSSKLSKKKAKMVFISWYIFMIATISLEYKDKLLGLIDYLINNIIYEFVFPNYLVFIIIFVITNIYVINSIISKNSTKIYKVINITMYSLTSFISFILFYLITKNNINVYNELDVYTNNDITSLIELTMIIFSIWTIINIIYKLVYRVCLKDKDDELKYMPVNMNNTIYEEEVNYFADLVDSNPRVINPNLEIELVKVNDDNMNFNTMINNVMSKNNLELLKELDKRNYSVYEYKILANMLKNSYNK